jgi:hypothetical protein
MNNFNPNDVIPVATYYRTGANSFGIWRKVSCLKTIICNKPLKHNDYLLKVSFKCCL